MPKLLQESRDPINILWYGAGGTGKTTDLAAMAHGGRICLINAESGIKRRALLDRGVPVKNIEIFPDPDNPKEEVSYDGLEGLWLRIREELHADPDAWAGVGWDSISEVQKAFTDQERVRANQRYEARGVERDPFIIDQDSRTKVNEQMRSLIRKFRDLPCHFGLTALERRDQDDDGTVSYMPAVTPGIQNDIIGYMDLICVTSVAVIDGEEEYRGLFRQHNKYHGKDRLGNRTPKWLVDPTFDRILEYVDGDASVETDPVMVAARERSLRAESKSSSDPARSGAKETKASANKE